MVELGVNIDHVATLRQARRTYEPDPVWAAVEAELGGADCITIHLREDRRHITDRDLQLLSQTVQCKLNLEMSLAAEIVEIGVKAAPAQVTLVPERRQEVTTEGGLDLLIQPDVAASAVKRLTQAGVFVSAFIDADERQIAAARQMGFHAVELHTGRYADATAATEIEELNRLERAGKATLDHGLRLHAGHGLNYRNVGPVARIEGMRELNIGHAIVSRAIFAGLRDSVRQMKAAIHAAQTNEVQTANLAGGGSTNFPSGSANFPSGSGNFPGGSANFAGGLQNRGEKRNV